MLFKYVVLHVRPYNEPEVAIPVLLPPNRSHLDARWMYRDAYVLSAGFVELTVENGAIDVNCYGESDELRSASRMQIDEELLRQSFSTNSNLPS